MMPVVHVFNGPNLNLLGIREPTHYGSGTLEDLRELCEKAASTAGAELDFRQSHHEGQLVDWIHEAGGVEAEGKGLGAVLNLGAYTHTSVAIRDAVSGVRLTAVEVHLSNVYAREDFRHHSFLAPVALGVIAGLGSMGYAHAIVSLAARAAAQSR